MPDTNKELWKPLVLLGSERWATIG